MPVVTNWDSVIGAYHSVGWYYLPMEMPETAEEKEVYIYISGIDSEAKLFIDGVMVGEHSGWNVPSAVKIPQSSRKPGPKLLAVKVWTPAGPGGIYGPMGLIVTRGNGR